MNKLSLICYHANIKKIYKPEWVEQFKWSIIGQSYKKFKVYELCYSGEQDRIFEDSIYESKELPTFVHAMNYLIEKCLSDGADVIGNTNVDDNYSANRLEVQMEYIKKGFDVVSSNFSLMKDNIVFHEHHFENKNIKEELNRNHNVICHPVLLYSSAFLRNNKYVPEDIPYEDMLLWKRTIDNYKFVIAPENLLYQRIHDNSVCKSENR